MGVMRDNTANASKLGARWQLNAAMLSKPADLSALVTLSQSKPKEFFVDNTLHVLVSKLLNCQNEQVSDKDTKLDVLAILANLSGSGDARTKQEVRTALQGVSEWFDDYLGGEQGDGLEQEPELHKSMLLLLARAWSYKLKTEDLLELTRGDRGLALDSVVGVLEDGKTYATELVQSHKPGQGAVAQWEHELVCRQHEKPLVLQLCRLVRGFTHPASYFAGESGACKCSRGDGVATGEDLALFSVDEFSTEMDSLLEITLRSRVIEKLSVALHVCLFAPQGEREQRPEIFQDELREEGSDSEGRDTQDAEGGGRRPSSGEPDDGIGVSGGYDEYRAPLEASDHLAVHCVHIFMQNLYHYATQNTDFYRQHMLSDTLLVPRLILPYLDQCVRQARLLCHRRGPSSANQSGNGWTHEESANAGAQEGVGRDGEQEATAEAALAQGIASSLRTLVIASFRAPPNMFVLGLMQRLNPTGSLLRARPFVARHDYIFTLLCLLNVNMGALNTSTVPGRGETAQRAAAADGDNIHSEILEAPPELSLEMVLAQGLVDDMAGVFQQMSPEAKRRVVRRVTQSGALPVSRDAPGYAAVLGVLGVVDGCEGVCKEEAGVDVGGGKDKSARAESKRCQEGEDWASDRKAAKSEAEARVRKLSRASITAAGDEEGSAEPPRAASHSRRSPELRNQPRRKHNESKTSGDGNARTTDRNARTTDGDYKSGPHHHHRKTTGGSMGVTSALAEAKVQEETDACEAEGEAKGGAGQGFALLGDLPSLGSKMSPAALADLKQQRVRVSLDLPGNAASFSSRLKPARSGSTAEGSRPGLSTASQESRAGGGVDRRRGSGDDGKVEGASEGDGGQATPGVSKRGRRGTEDLGEDGGADGIPKEFLCAINGHMMKHPARSPHGHVFEYSTILLWLESRGRVCPFTGKPLSKEELVPDEELRTRVMRWHIQKTSVNAARATPEDDDIYDF